MTTANGDVSEPVTTITGGAFGEIAGSGKLAASPDSAKAKAVISRITLTYTAVHLVDECSIADYGAVRDYGVCGDWRDQLILLLMILLTNMDTFLLQATDHTKKGYISSPDSQGSPAGIGYADTSTLWRVRLPPLHGIL